MDQSQSGFTLVELMIVVVVVSILMGISIPGYRGYVMRANRVDATTSLLRIAAAQEKFYLQHHPARYAITPEELSDAPPDGLGIAMTERGFYRLAVKAGIHGASRGFIAIAVVNSSENQAADADCALFRIDEQGRRSAQSATGMDTTDICWR